MNERVINNKTGYICDDDNFFCNQTIKLLNDDPLFSQDIPIIVLRRSSRERKETDFYSSEF